jgi:hypothetical protein
MFSPYLLVWVFKFVDLKGVRIDTDGASDFKLFTTSTYPIRCSKLDENSDAVFEFGVAMHELAIPLGHGFPPLD